MKTKMNRLTTIYGIIILIASLCLTSCRGSSKKNTNSGDQKDTLAYLYGKWKFEEMGVEMTLKIYSDKSFSWSSSFGSYNGVWSIANNILYFTPSDNLNPPFKLIKNNDGSLQEQTNEGIKPVYIKVE